jgi:diguanylate cyclase (GGDEF)-like protein/PAS domain S-box-containing protein
MAIDTTVDEMPLPAERVAQVHSRAERVAQILRRAALVCATLIVVLGAAVMLGWLVGSDLLMAVLPGHIRMKANTAAAFIAAGLALAINLKGSRDATRWVRVFAAISLCFGATAEVEYAFHVDLRVDELFFRDPIQLTFPGRMAHITAVCFCLAGAAQLLLGGGRIARALAQWLALSVGVIAFAAMVGSLYGVKTLYGSVDYTSMALHTGAGFLVLGAGLVLSRPDSTLIRIVCAPGMGGWLARRALPVAILAPVLLGWLYLLPGVDLGSPRFGMALFAVTLAAAGSGGLWLVALFMNRAESQRAEMIRVREEGEAAVRQSERELRLVTDHLPTLLSYIDTSGRFLRVNRTYEAWLGVPAADILGRQVHEVLGRAYWERTLHAIDAVLRGETAVFETAHPTIHGERQTHVTYAPDIDDAGRVRGIACMVLDIEEQRKAEEATRERERLEQANKHLFELANTDELTGLNNRRAFEEHLRVEYERARHVGSPLSLLMIDVDNFKLRNDTWGHGSGDEVLRTLGGLLSAAVRTPDVTARYGGEEFATLLPGSSLPQAVVIAERIRRAVLKENWKDSAVTLSIGVATVTSSTGGIETLVREADEALYEAKRLGKNRVHAASGEKAGG